MDRRDFLWLGLAGTAAAGTGCAAVPSPTGPIAPRDMNAFLAHLDHAMDSIQRGDAFGEMLAAFGVDVAAVSSTTRRVGTTLYRKALRSMLLVGYFRDLPEEQRLHPGVQSRVGASMKEMDEAVLGSDEILSSLSRERQDELRAFLTRDRDLPSRMVDVLERDAKQLDVTDARRTHLRSLVAHVGWRLRAQHPSVLIADYHDKIDQVGDPRRRGLAAGDGGRLPLVRTASTASTGVNGAVTVGGYMLGISAVVTAVGYLIAGGGELAGAFLVTFGVLGLIAGLITLLVGAIIEAAK